MGGSGGLFTAVVVAGGTGERFGRSGGKQLAVAAGLPVLGHTLLAFERCDDVDAVVLVTAPGRTDEYRDAAVSPLGLRKVVDVVPGGDTRQRSVAAGLAALPEGTGIVAVHDGARPLIMPADISSALHDLRSSEGIDGVVVGHPSYDTVKMVDAASRVVRQTPDRRALWVAQTPQVFHADVLRRAMAEAEAQGFEGTDDASLVERAGGRVRMVPGPRDNLKVTTEEDLRVVEALLSAREG